MVPRLAAIGEGLAPKLVQEVTGSVEVEMVRCSRDVGRGCSSNKRVQRLEQGLGGDEYIVPALDFGRKRM